MLAILPTLWETFIKIDLRWLEHHIRNGQPIAISFINIRGDKSGIAIPTDLKNLFLNPSQSCEFVTFVAK